jgi:hypothetical protein
MPSSALLKAFGVKHVPSIVPLDDLRCSATLPTGYMTVGDWWAANEPDTLELMPDPVCVLAEDADRLVAICENRGLNYMQVAPTRLARQLGFPHSRAFPVELLNEFYPINP